MRDSERNYKSWVMVKIAQSFHSTLAACICLLALTGSSLGAANSSVPRGISLELGWNDKRIEKFLDSGQEQPGYQMSTVQVYISEQGRFFSKFIRKSRGAGNL